MEGVFKPQAQKLGEAMDLHFSQAAACCWSMDHTLQTSALEEGMSNT
jgi:hypothetical protein